METVELAFRPAVADDVPSVTALVRHAYERYVEAIGREPAPMTVDYGEVVADQRVLVALNGRQIVGVLVWELEPDHLLIENVAVDPAQQGAGIGSALLGQGEAIAREHGRDELRLYTNAKMTENLTYYPARGFTEVGRRTEDGFDRVYFSRAL